MVNVDDPATRSGWGILANALDYLKGKDIDPNRFSYTRAFLESTEDLERLLTPTAIVEEPLIQIDPVPVAELPEGVEPVYINAVADTAPYVEQAEDYPEWNFNHQGQEVAIPRPKDESSSSS